MPQRAEQLATLAALVPFGPDQPFTALDLGSGQGALSATLMTCFPQASVTALDGSPSMLERSRALLARFGGRATTVRFDLAGADWLDLARGADVVVSSLALHHLDAGSRRRLFAELHQRLSERGAMLVADLIEPQRIESARVFAASWDRLAEAQARLENAPDEALAHWYESHWNLFRFPDPHVDKPSPLFDQLRWLSEAGFVAVDCFWLVAGHAIYGGYMPAATNSGERLDFNTAQAAAIDVLRAL